MSTCARTAPAHFERLYRDCEDPWGFETSAYEDEKYRRTLRALGERRFGRALEVGCSIGVFTEMLAGRCDQLVAIEPAPTALARARDRLRRSEHVELREAAVPEGLPGGPFDLVVCSEVLYYLRAPLLVETLAAIEALLAPAGATLLAVHWRPAARSHALTGDEVHDLLLSHTRLTHALGERHEHYRLDRFDRA